MIKKPIGDLGATAGRTTSTSSARARTSPTSTRARNDAEFWRGVREGTISDAGRARRRAARGRRSPGSRRRRTAASPAAGESITRELYELLARTDCENARRMAVLDLFLMPVRNPDGRDAVTAHDGVGV